jgi:hypothetical protein
VSGFRRGGPQAACCERSRGEPLLDAGAGPTCGYSAPAQGASESGIATRTDFAWRHFVRSYSLSGSRFHRLRPRHVEQTDQNWRTEGEKGPQALRHKLLPPTLSLDRQENVNVKREDRTTFPARKRSRIDDFSIFGDWRRWISKEQLCPALTQMPFDLLIRAQVRLHITRRSVWRE